jgi:nucleotide-binding universal stress UspA family protein
MFSTWGTPAKRQEPLPTVDTDPLVVGKHGAHIAEELLLGRVTRHVLAESQCDVLVIPDPRKAPERTP